jgi:lysozyme
MSVEWADDLLQQDVEYFASAISGFIRVPVTENQFSALVSLGYNIGINALKNSTVIKRLNAGNTESAAEAILWWNKASGKVLGGLVLRREAEKDLFSKP